MGGGGGIDGGVGVGGGVDGRGGGREGGGVGVGRVGEGGMDGGWAVGRTREGLTAEVNLEITTTAGRLSINETWPVLSPEEGGRGGGCDIHNTDI